LIGHGQDLEMPSTARFGRSFARRLSYLPPKM